MNEADDGQMCGIRNINILRPYTKFSEVSKQIMNHSPARTPPEPPSRTNSPAEMNAIIHNVNPEQSSLYSALQAPSTHAATQSYSRLRVLVIVLEQRQVGTGI